MSQLAWMQSGLLDLPQLSRQADGSLKMGIFIGGLKESHSQTLTPSRHGHTMRSKSPFLGFPSSSCWLWSVSWHYIHILNDFFKIPQLPLVLSSISWSRQADEPTHASRWAKKSEAGTCSNSTSFWNAEHFAFSISSKRCDVTEVNTPHIKAAIHHGNSFSCKEWGLSLPGPKRTKDVQTFLEQH